MTTARLEELAVWAEKQAVWRDEGDNYADLARCARAWAKVERMGTRHARKRWFWTFCFASNGCFTLGTLFNSTHDNNTAMEAVEAAEVGK